ncbi:MAG: hypothetical protein NZ561_12590, partial [Phycisphaerae bacterium]|nr:hypothetical protein [Phycisphaerae bacterium]
GLELPAVALPTLPEAQPPTVTLTASLPIEPPAEPEPVGPIPLVSLTPEPIYACPPEPIVLPTPSTTAPQIGAPEPIRLPEFSGTTRELDAAEPPIPPPIDLSEPPRAAPEWSELPPAPPVTLPVAEVHTPCEVEPAEPLAIRDVPTAVVEQQPMPDSTPALSLPRVEIPPEPEPSTVDLPVLETPPASVAAEIPPAEPPPLVAPDIVEPQVPAGEAPAPFMPAEPPSTELSAPPAEESIRATISLPPPSAAEPDRLPQVNEAPPQLTIAEPPAPPSPPEEPPQPPPLEIPSSAEPAASGPSLALDEVVAEIPLTVTTDDGQSLLLGETSPSSETAFALVIPPVEAPEQVSFVPPPPQLLEPMSIAPDLVHPAPANIEAPELNLVPTPEPLPPEIEIELAPRPVDTQDSTVVSGSQPETPVAPQSEPPASVEITATATLSPGQGPAAPSPSAFEPELTPPPLPANAPPLELDDSEVPLKLVPPRPRKTPGTRDSAGRAPWVADPAVPAQPSPFAAGAIAPGDPFVASPADPFTPSPAPASLDALEMAPGADPEALSGRNRPARDQRRADPAATRPARQVQQVAPAFVPSVPLATPLAPARSEEAIELEELRRRRLKWIPTMLLGSILLMAGAVAAIWHLFPVQQEVEAALRFEGFSSMSMVEQKALQAEQNALLRQDYVRKAAIRKLRELRPEVSAGFLGSPVAYDRVIMLSGWPDSRPGEFVLRYRGTDPADRYRLHALTQALFNDERTRRRIETARNERAAIRRLEEDIESNTRKLTELRKQIERERFLGENRPQPGQIEALETAVLSAERQWTDALAKLKEAQAEEARIEKLLSAARQNPPAAPENDPELSRLTQQLTDLQAEYRALQSRQSEQATLARQEIDEAMDAFQRQIEAARGRGGESPELAQYIASAENLQTTTRALLDEQLDRQQQQYQRLTELKRQLDEKAAARAAELRSSDPQLRELLDERELLRRQINAGVGAGIDRAELAPYEERLKLAESMIRAREEVLSSDPLYVDMITSLQKEIDQMQADLAANRRKIDEKLEELQKSFAASAPAVANLPEEQKQIALQVRQQLAAITAARQRYTEVLEADRRATEEKLNQMQGQIVALQSEIDTRKRILSDEFVNKSVTALTEALEAQRKVVEAAREAESLARAEFESKGRELRGLKDTVEALKNSDERMVRLIGEREQTEQFLKSLNDQLEFRRSNASTGLLEIRAPAEADVKVIAGEDRRLIYILSAVGVIVLLTSGSIWWTLHSAGKMEFVPATPEPLTGAAAAGNTLAAGAAGHDLAAVPARPGTSDGDDEQPAVV